MSLGCFKSYDVRGKVPSELDATLAEKIGAAYAKVLGPKRVAVGHDMRLSSPELAFSLIQGLTRGGADVLFLGQCGTEEVYFATFQRELDGGIMVTASHNPADYNGMKMVGPKASPVSRDNGLTEIEQLAAGDVPSGAARGQVTSEDLRSEYLDYILRSFDTERLKGRRMVCNAGNGCAGPVVLELAQRLGWNLQLLHGEPDGHFPHGVPNPLLPEKRHHTTEAVLKADADLGVAWDGDFDRCFFFDEHGEFVDGYYLVGLLAERALFFSPGGTILHDPRQIWNTIKRVEASGGRALQIPTGHAIFKKYMQAEGACYGGEMSSHHYFREFAGCDSGMLPWLWLLEWMSYKDRGLAELIRVSRETFPVSGELNRTVKDAQIVMDEVRARYEPEAIGVDTMDGISLEFENWRFNLRRSNTEPLLRLNLETRGDEGLLCTKTEELLELIEAHA